MEARTAALKEAEATLVLAKNALERISITHRDRITLRSDQDGFAHISLRSDHWPIVEEFDAKVSAALDAIAALHNAPPAAKDTEPKP
jgi:hypothetical protein